MSGSALRWFKSSYSGSDGGNCIEVAYEWHRSSHSGSEGGECVEIAQEPTAIHIRDSKAPQGHVTVGPGAWVAFLGAFGAR
ncbi:DUF397 domain-containing protein [Streptomyces sp. NPDC088935]|uniref:DUF397 domain-containing protein n=1 Tax=Streptomyces sp. NPDC088935 TaxID=3365916 RepID=UPI003816E55E